MNKFSLLLVSLLMVVISGCGMVTQADRDFAHEVLAQSGNNCVHIQGSGGAGTVPMVGAVVGGYGQGSLTAAHSESSQPLSCNANGAEVKPQP